MTRRRTREDDARVEWAGGRETGQQNGMFAGSLLRGSDTKTDAWLRPQMGIRSIGSISARQFVREALLQEHDSARASRGRAAQSRRCKKLSAPLGPVSGGTPISSQSTCAMLLVWSLADERVVSSQQHRCIGSNLSAARYKLPL